MSPDAPKTANLEPAPSGPAIVSVGWLAGKSTFGEHDERKLGRPFIASLILHGALLALVLLVFAVGPQKVVDELTPIANYIYVKEEGPGGGGGGSPSPAPPKKVEIPKPKVAETTPQVVIPVDVPPPTLQAPVMTNADLVQATGSSAVSLAAYGGGGSGGGIGPGRGNGVGPGTGGGTGGGAYRPGAGITNPTLIKKFEPKYTSEAMRAKVQGTVEIEAVVQSDGTVGEIKILKSLDKVYGLDQEAIKAAKMWTFHPGLDRDGKPIDVWVRIALDFNLH